jgi:hypothetical protein
VSNRKMPGLYKQARKDGSYEWKIDKRYGCICEGTGTCDYDEAEAYLTGRLEGIRKARQLRIRPKRRFREAATKYLTAHVRRRGISRDATSLKNLDPYIGDLILDEIHDGSFHAFRESRAGEGICIGTVDRDIGVAARVLEEAARKWWDEKTNLTWQAETPMIEYTRKYNERLPYPLDWQEQRLLFSELATQLQRMALLEHRSEGRGALYLGMVMEQRVPELDTPTSRRTVFVLPEGVRPSTGRLEPWILNDVAQSIVDSQRGLHQRYVFTFPERGGSSAYRRA